MKVIETIITKLCMKMQDNEVGVISKKINNGIMSDVLNYLKSSIEDGDEKGINMWLDNFEFHREYIKKSGRWKKRWDKEYNHILKESYQ